MDHFTMGDVLPLSGSAAQLLTAAIAMQHPMTLTELAKTAGISKFAASRAAAVLMEHGLLQQVEFGYEFNEQHLLAPTVRDLAWRFSGVRRTERVTGWPLPGRIRKRANWEDDFSFRRRVPDSLLRKAEVDPLLDGTSGPDLVTVRDLCTWIEQIIPELLDYERAGREVYGRWSNERLRDMVHQTLHFTNPLEACLATLIAASDVRAQAGADPRTVHTNAQTWTRATYLISAEAQNVMGVITILDTAIRVGGRVNTLRDNAVNALHNLNHKGQDSQFAQRWLTEALSAERDASVLWDDQTQGPYRNVGGMPRPRDVGTAGDQTLAVRLLWTAQTLTNQVAAMASHPSIEAWQAAHPDEAEDSPLYTVVPEDLLEDPQSRPMAQR